MSTASPTRILLFESDSRIGISIDSAAAQANVSTATIRNWIKTGYLQKTARGLIEENSLARFLAEIAGAEKLNGRANKTQKDIHDHTRLTEEFLHHIARSSVSSAQLIADYEQALSDSHRNKEGVYYTPMAIVRDMFSSTPADISNQTFCDPCCGGGNFIIRAIECGIKPENIYGYDVDPVAVALTRKRIFELTGFNSSNIKQADFLEEASNNKTLVFDCIYTNPPWGKKIPRQEKERYAKLLKAGKSIDTCSLFFFACLRCLSPNGELGLLLPNSFFNIATFESARKKALSLDVTRLVDYGTPFKKLMSGAQGIFLKNRPAQNQSIICRKKESQYFRTPQSFLQNPKAIINLYADAATVKVIEHVFSRPHITLKNNAEWGLGIVTGNNKKFCSPSPAQGLMPVFKGTDIHPGKTSSPGCFIPADLSLYQQAASPALYEAKGKLLYRFISSRLCFYWDTEQRYFLNSVNMLIPQNGFPLFGEQLCALLSSDFMNWIYQNLFDTCKILRSDLETLPIDQEYFQKNPIFDEAAYLDALQIKKEENGTYSIKK